MTRRSVSLVASVALVVSLALAPSCARQNESARGDAGPAAWDSASIVIQPVTPAELAAIVRAPGAKATLVNVWASWCGPCREEFPDLVRLRGAYGGRGLRLVFVSADFEEDLPAARRFLAEQRVDWPTYLKTGDDMQFIDSLDPRWSGALPGSFLYDRNGRLIRSWEGKASYATLEERVLPSLEATVSPDTLEDRS